MVGWLGGKGKNGYMRSRRDKNTTDIAFIKEDKKKKKKKDEPVLMGSYFDIGKGVHWGL